MYRLIHKYYTLNDYIKRCLIMYMYRLTYPPISPPSRGIWQSLEKCCTEQRDNPERQKRTDKRLTSPGVVALFYLNIVQLFIVFI